MSESIGMKTSPFLCRTWFPKISRSSRTDAVSCVTSRSESESIITMSPSSNCDSMSLRSVTKRSDPRTLEPAPFIIPGPSWPVGCWVGAPCWRPWFDLLRLINILRLEDGSPQTFRNLGFGLDFDPILPNNEGVEEVGVSCSSHFRNLDFSRAHLHRERILF